MYPGAVLPLRRAQNLDLALETAPPDSAPAGASELGTFGGLAVLGGFQLTKHLKGWYALLTSIHGILIGSPFLGIYSHGCKATNKVASPDFPMVTSRGGWAGGEGWEGEWGGQVG